MADNATTAKTETSIDAGLLAKVQERIDFFFGDVNFGRDRFLRNRTMAIPDRYIPISILLSFNTLKKLTMDPAVVAAAAKNSDVVEVNQAGEGLRRKVPFESASSSDEVTRRVHAAGFPLLNVTWEKVRDAFKCCGKVTYVRLRRDRDTKVFLGSVFLDFSTAESAAKAVASTPEYEGTKLKDVKMFVDWLEASRAQKRAEGKQPARSAKQQIESVEEIEAEEKNKFILRVSKLPEDCAWQDIKRTFVDISESKGLETAPAFVDLFEGVAFLRYNAIPEDCTKLLEELKKSKTLINETEVEVDAASPEQREAYWTRMFLHKKEKSVNKKIMKRKENRNKQRRGRKSGGGGRSFRNEKRQRVDQTATAATTTPSAGVAAKPSVDVAAEPAAKKQKA